MFLKRVSKQCCSEPFAEEVDAEATSLMAGVGGVFRGEEETGTPVMVLSPEGDER
jgi:hypothetical protein